MFIGRRKDGSIYGSWTERQPDDADHPGQEEVADDDKELIAFLAPEPLKDPADLNSAQSDVKAIVLAAAILAGKTPAEASAAFKQARNSLKDDIAIEGVIK